MSALAGRIRPRTLGLALARRIALAAQGFGEPRPPDGTVTQRQLLRVVDRVAVVQIDSVNVLVRSHYLPFFSRLGPYDPTLLDRARDVPPRRLVEYTVHEASLVHPSLWALHDHRMRAAAQTSWGPLRRIVAEQPELVESVFDEVARRGPATARQLQAALEHDRPRAGDQWGWNWSDVKIALEYLFWAGRISSAGRTAQFERRYAALGQVAPPAYRAQWLDPSLRPAEPQACVELMRVAARACGVATEGTLADYFRISRVRARPAIARLVADGELEPVSVTGWGHPAYLHVGARRPRQLHVEALVSPFDSLVWQRQRTEELFGVRYRIEIYTPAAQRVHGYYVLPFLYGDRIVARCDLKADRRAGLLLVQRLTWEPHAPPEAGDALARELATLARWLRLDDVSGPSARAE
ncbi:MAG: winged helix-turn-helix domain-containing protein [Dermatophilaceae bacterium]